MGSSRGSSSRDKLRTYILQNIGRKIEAVELRAVSGNASDWARRVRELRTLEGYQILTHNDRSDLKPGQYLLLDGKVATASKCEISKEIRAFVLSRDGSTCQLCGAVAAKPHPTDRTLRTQLLVACIIGKSEGGSDDPKNLRTAAATGAVFKMERGVGLGSS